MFVSISESIGKELLALKRRWDAKESILEMKNGGGKQWRQMEWIGWYFEYKCEELLADLFERFQYPKYGNTAFDGFYHIPWDFKSHVSGDLLSGIRKPSNIVINDAEACEKAIRDYGQFGVIVACGLAIYNDEDRSFQEWHTDLKGGLSNYEILRVARTNNSRLRKTSFETEEIRFVHFTKDVLSTCGS
ncbi:MAG: hypothetical protein WCS47_09150, partial [Thermovirgaceae bacterium]